MRDVTLYYSRQIFVGGGNVIKQTRTHINLKNIIFTKLLENGVTGYKNKYISLVPLRVEMEIEKFCLGNLS